MWVDRVRLATEDELLEWTVRCVTVFDEFLDPLSQPGPEILAIITQGFGLGTSEDAWLNVTGKPLSAVVREYVESGGTNG